MQKHDLRCCDVIEGLAGLGDETVDLVVTSPPYDALRAYDAKSDGSKVDLGAVGDGLYRVVVRGGVVVVVLQDQTKNWAKTLTTFRTAVDWCDRIGFGLFESCIYHRQGTPGAWWTKRFRVDHEYMLIFVKGTKPRAFDKEHLKLVAKYAGRTFGKSTRTRSGAMVGRGECAKIPKLKCRGTIWHYVNNTKDTSEDAKLKRRHPASFPDLLAEDHIRCWTKPGDTVLDPFMGSGTVGVACAKHDRRFIGIDVSQDYCELARRRLALVTGELVAPSATDEVCRCGSVMEATGHDEWSCPSCETLVRYYPL